ncbi:MAG: sigma-54-dependent Fis family transcriptional regulator [Phycisphaeraceae bacterium]|nr:MAG: sigma-54-dependent Fis family transcriptional regulator [Phycisphaeraceae bacterium]
MATATPQRSRLKLSTGERSRVLIVDDDPIVADSLAEFLVAEGYDAATAFNAHEALEVLADAERPDAGVDALPRPFNVVITDVNMPGMDGIELLRKINEKHSSTVVLVLTAYGSIESAVDAVKLGAADYLTKPLVDSELRISLEKALRQQALLAENHSLRSQLDTRFGLDNIVGQDHRMLKIYDLIEAVAPSKTTVLMTGESGTGKSLIARAIHHRSARRDKPFVEISCGSIPETLLESELFGHVKGAFTGAHADKVGRFLAADGGTIFLDEINSASPGMQLKLLRVLQERRFEPVGSTRTIEVDARVILASNQPLEAMVANGEFRQDLYYRINVVRIDLPPLRDRTPDIPLLADHFLHEHASEQGKQLAGFSEEAMDALRRYPFPGNVRELSNVVERAVVLSRKGMLTIEDLPPNVLAGESPYQMPGEPAERSGAGDDADQPWTPMPLAEAMLEPEKRILLKALRANDWNRQATADQLGVNRTTLYKKMKLHGLDRMSE